MSFSYLPWWAVFGGALTLIVLLYLLQHLRVQPKIIKIASIHLWQQAMQQTAANKFWQRFSHWLGFIVSTLIALLLWAALSGLKSHSGSSPLHLYFLDTSVAMTIGDNLVAAKSRLEQDFPTEAGTGCVKT